VAVEVEGEGDDEVAVALAVAELPEGAGDDSARMKALTTTAVGTGDIELLPRLWLPSLSLSSPLPLIDPDRPLPLLWPLPLVLLGLPLLPLPLRGGVESGISARLTSACTSGDAVAEGTARRAGVGEAAGAEAEVEVEVAAGVAVAAEPCVPQPRLRLHAY